MKVSQIARTDLGNMVGDYIATAVPHGRAFSLFAVGKPPAASRKFKQAIYTAGGLSITGGMRSAPYWEGEAPVVPAA